MSDLSEQIENRYYNMGYKKVDVIKWVPNIQIDIYCPLCGNKLKPDNLYPDRWKSLADDTHIFDNESQLFECENDQFIRIFVRHSSVKLVDISVV